MSIYLICYLLIWTHVLILFCEVAWDLSCPCYLPTRRQCGIIFIICVLFICFGPYLYWLEIQAPCQRTARIVGLGLLLTLSVNHCASPGNTSFEDVLAIAPFQVQDRHCSVFLSLWVFFFFNHEWVLNFVNFFSSFIVYHVIFLQ